MKSSDDESSENIFSSAGKKGESSNLHKKGINHMEINRSSHFIDEQEEGENIRTSEATTQKYSVISKVNNQDRQATQR